MKLTTKIIHQNNPTHSESGAVMPPIVMSTTFEREEDQLSLTNGYIYSRYSNPNRDALEGKIKSMENGVACLAFSSGLAAATAIFQSLSKGDHIILPDDAYFSVKKIVDTLFKNFDLQFSLVDMSNLEELKKSIQTNTKCIWIESPSNPLIKLSDFQSIVKIAVDNNCFTVVDNTWSTPYHTKPIELGVDIVLHSTTKYMGGHSDILGGALVFKEANNRFEFIKNVQKLGGAVPSPFDCWLLCRSLSTFELRIKKHSDNAILLAQYLETQPKIRKVLYPGLTSHPQHELAKKQMQNGYTGMLSIIINGTRDETLEICKKLKIFKHATSLGGVESLIEHRKSSEGIDSKTPENLLRISVGIEDIEDLINDFEQALIPS